MQKADIMNQTKEYAGKTERNEDTTPEETTSTEAAYAQVIFMGYSARYDTGKDMPPNVAPICIKAGDLDKSKGFSLPK